MAAVAAACGLAADDPVACAVAVSSGMLALGLDERAGRSLALAGGSRRGPLAGVLGTALFRGFRGNDAPRAAGLQGSGNGSEPPATAPDRPPEEADANYEEFAAGLEDEPEEISFLPPYVSGGESADEEEDDDRGHEPPPVDSPLLQELNDVLDPGSRMPMPRRFALGTVAILRNLLDPDEVTRILEEQRRYPRLRFGDIAVELGMLTAGERDELVLAQQEGVFSDEEILDAKRRLESHYASGNRRV